MLSGTVMSVKSTVTNKSIGASKSKSMLDFFGDDRISCEVHTVGSEQLPVLIFDFPSEIADFLIGKASTYGPDWIPASSIYPGIWSKVPNGYGQALLEFIEPYVRQNFFTNELIEVKNIVSTYAMAVTPQDQLQVRQRVPHFDSFEPRQLACVQYLCDNSFGGTGFYRHKATGIEKMDAERYPVYLEALRNDIDVLGEPAAEYCGDCHGSFEKIFECEAKLGRLLLYPSALLHSGLLNSAKNTERKPQNGRLTITSFIKY